MYNKNRVSTSHNNKLIINLPNITEWGFQENINNEFSSIGLYLSSHPLDSYYKILPRVNIKNISQILKEPQNYYNKNIKLCGLLFKIQKRQSYNGRWASIHLSDLTGSSEILIYSDVLQIV